MVLKSFTKDPDATLDYVFDWSDWLASAEVITSMTATVETGLTLDSSSSTISSATLWLSGGTDGKTYTVSCKITTSAGRIDERSINIHVKNR